MEKYKKFIVSALGTVLVGLSLFAGIDLPFAPDAVYALVASVLASLGVVKIANS